MRDVRKIIQLDFLSVRPYLTIKNLFIIVGLGIFYAAVSKNTNIPFNVMQMFAILFSSYPFFVGDQGGIDTLYRIFGIREKYVVWGRYISSLLVNLICVLIGAILSGLLSFIINEKTFHASIFVMIPIYFVVNAALISLQYPFYFRYGYAKAKMVITTLFLSMGIFFFVMTYFKEFTSGMFGFIAAHIMISVLMCAVILAAIYFGSVALSIRWYQEKEWE